MFSTVIKITVDYGFSSVEQGIRTSARFQWVYNILEHKAEQDKIVYEDKDEKTGFVIVNDLKWDGQPNTLKLLALPFQKIRSIRELNASHLELLRNIRDSGTATILKQYNIPASQLRIYLHYQPSYYHLHVHFAYLMFETPGNPKRKLHRVTNKFGISVSENSFAHLPYEFRNVSSLRLFYPFSSRRYLRGEGTSTVHGHKKYRVNARLLYKSCALVRGYRR